MSKLTLKQANTIIEKGFAKARDMKIKPLGIVVLDGSGAPKETLTGYGTLTGSFQRKRPPLKLKMLPQTRSR